jgi:hypothetical protein
MLICLNSGAGSVMDICLALPLLYGLIDRLAVTQGLKL